MAENAASLRPTGENAPNRGGDRPIALVGLMGAGKSTVGQRLAKRLGLPFVDVDSEIERAAGLDISAIFARYGEAEFRDGERRVIARLVNGPVQVIATGGGAFVHEATRRLLLERCQVVWLDAQLELLAERVGRRGGRPLLDGRDPLAALTELAAERAPFYAEAHIRIDAGEDRDTTVDAIVAALGDALGGVS
jgi:shikimate kinase